ncbi:hypothetical protein Q8A67_024492 [Cirrhinus molitorella]|uniref:Uncharacterized protein n=1 Tax=Cirrhinus molitorella TaxID=172907 RepID=A0AA88P098_9TELE|nr:hypothetical protein Q8A67_024492 [Cirrhinus molitorella]
MDQLTEELQAALDNLKSQTGKIHHCEEEIERFREKMDSHQKCTGAGKLPPFSLCTMMMATAQPNGPKATLPS